MAGQAAYDSLTDVFRERLLEEAFDLRNVGGTLHIYRGGAWNIMSVEDHAMITRILYEIARDQGFPIAEKKSRVWDNLHMAVEQLHPDALDLTPKIALLNGTYDLETEELSDHDPDDFTTRRVAVEFDPRATCPEWDAMLLRCVADKPKEVQEQYINFLQQHFGMSLLGFPPGTARDLRKGVFLIGETGTGKTSIAEVLREMFHVGEVATETIEQLGKDFGLQTLMSSRAYIADDAADKKTKMNPTVFKKLITGEPMTAAIKYQPNRSFRYRGPVVITSNVRPKIEDETDAMYNRLVVLTFTRVFSPADKEMLAPFNSVVPFLKKRKQFPGIFNWALVGGKQAKEMQRFTSIADAKENAKEWRSENDVVFDFLRRFGVADAEAYCSVPLLAQMIALYALHEHHARKGEWPPKKVSNQLVQQIATAFPGSSIKRYDRADTSGNVIIGLRINSEGEGWAQKAKEADMIPPGVRWRLNGKVL